MYIINGEILNKLKGKTTKLTQQNGELVLNVGSQPIVNNNPIIHIIGEYFVKTNQSSYTIIGQVLDPNNLSVILDINSISISLDGEGRFSHTVDLVEDENLFTLTTTNSNDYISSKSVTVIKKTIPTTLNLISNVIDFKTTIINIIPSEEGISDVVLYYRIKNQGHNYTSINLGVGLTKTLENLASGCTYEYYVTSIDAYGNSCLSSAYEFTTPTVQPTSNITYNFEDGVIPSNFVQSGQGIQIVQDAKTNGSKVIGFKNKGINSSKAGFNFDVNLTQITNVNFDFYIGSEKNYDWLIVTVDGTTRLKISGNSTTNTNINTNIDGITGLTACAWKTYTLKNLSVGNHNLKFEYEKDSSGAYADDMAYIDNITWGASDIVAPTIGNVSVSDITENSTFINFNTNEYSDTIIEYGTSASLEQSVSQSFYCDIHKILLSGLQSNTTYYYQIKSKDPNGNLTTNNNGGTYYTFTTLQSQSPSSDITIASTLATSTIQVYNPVIIAKADVVINSKLATSNGSIYLPSVVIKKDKSLSIIKATSNTQVYNPSLTYNKELSINTMKSSASASAYEVGLLVGTNITINTKCATSITSSYIPTISTTKNVAINSNLITSNAQTKMPTLTTNRDIIINSKQIISLSKSYVPSLVINEIDRLMDIYIPSIDNYLNMYNPIISVQKNVNLQTSKSLANIVVNNPNVYVNKNISIQIPNNESIAQAYISTVDIIKTDKSLYIQAPIAANISTAYNVNVVTYKNLIINTITSYNNSESYNINIKTQNNKNINIDNAIATTLIYNPSINIIKNIVIELPNIFVNAVGHKPIIDTVVNVNIMASISTSSVLASIPKVFTNLTDIIFTTITVKYTNEYELNINYANEYELNMICLNEYDVDMIMSGS